MVGCCYLCRVGFEVIAGGCFADDGSARAEEYDGVVWGSHGSAALHVVELLACRRLDCRDGYRC